MVLLVFISAFFFLMFADSSSDSDPDEDVTVSPTYDGETWTRAPTEVIAAIGGTASGDTAEATVYSARRMQAYNWTTSSSASAFTEEAESGMSYLIIDAEVKNTGSDALYASTGDFSLGDGEGNRYEPGLYYGDGSFGYMEELAQNQKNRGKILFEIPRDAQDLKLYYDFGIGYGGSQVASWPVE